MNLAALLACFTPTLLLRTTVGRKGDCPNREARLHCPQPLPRSATIPRHLGLLCTNPESGSGESPWAVSPAHWPLTCSWIGDPAPQQISSYQGPLVHSAYGQISLWASSARFPLWSSSLTGVYQANWPHRDNYMLLILPNAPLWVVEAQVFLLPALARCPKCPFLMKSFFKGQACFLLFLLETWYRQHYISGDWISFILNYLLFYISLSPSTHPLASRIQFSLNAILLT